MESPTVRLARSLHAEPGHVILDRSGVRWRWDGAHWEPLRAGDTVRHTNHHGTWLVWTGTTLEPAELAPGALVRVTWHRDGVNWDNQMCTLEAIEEGPERWFLVASWPTADQCAVVLEIVVDLVAPPVPVDLGPSGT